MQVVCKYIYQGRMSLKKITLCEEDSNEKINTRFLTQVVSKKLGRNFAVSS